MSQKMPIFPQSLDYVCVRLYRVDKNYPGSRGALHPSFGFLSPKPFLLGGTAKPRFIISPTVFGKP